LISANGTLAKGSSFVTVEHVSTGTYRLTFPVGTWPSFPVLTVSPYSLPGFFPVAEVNSLAAPGDGSATVVVIVSSTAGTFTPADASFTFTATAT
jgi:hypothetical protein